MCKQSSYSKYQKRVIKFLNDLLGTDTPFTYERAKNNHLKVLIEGIPKPIYTGSTPSDCKSINNFMAEVKRELKARKNEEEKAPQQENRKLISLLKQSNDIYCEYDEFLLDRPANRLIHSALLNVNLLARGAANQKLV